MFYIFNVIYIIIQIVFFFNTIFKKNNFFLKKLYFKPIFSRLYIKTDF